MAHKVHPKIFRLREAGDWSSRWLANKNYPHYLEEDFRVREFFRKYLGDIGLEQVDIERTPSEIKVILKSSRPGLLIGRGGEGIEKIKKRLAQELLLKGTKRTLKLEVVEVRDVWARAALVAQWMARQIERRLPHRRVLKQALERIMIAQEVKGAKVEVAGRLGGAEIARREWLKKGNLPRQTLRAKIDYAQARARCSYGTIGVKVWIYKGE